jgi:multidrug efflux pump subunit AcrB
MIASYLLSRTLVPTMAMFMLKPHAIHEGEKKRSSNPLVRFQHSFERNFERAREGYRNILAMAIAHRGRFVIGYLLVIVISFALVPFLGEDFFPSVDAGEITLHVRPPVGTRIEVSAAEFGHIERYIRQVIPPAELASIVDNMGLPVSSINTVYNNSGVIGYQDGDIFVSLNKHHHPTAGYVRTLRARLPQLFPGTTVSFLPADIVSQILNFGSPAPLDLQVAGPDRDADQAYATMLLRRMRTIHGIADARIQQSQDNPQLKVNIDRTKMAQFGLTENDVTNSVVTMLSGSTQTQPTFWLNPKNGVSYPISAQTPEYQVSSLSDLENIPVTGASGTGGVQVLGGLGPIHREFSSAVASHYNIQPVVDIFATTQGRDLGGVGHDIQRSATTSRD